MGCFDTLYLQCPECHKGFEIQSKAGSCDLQTYGLSDAPLAVIADVQEDGRRGRLSCGHCQARLILDVMFVAQVRKPRPDEEEDW